MRNIPIEYTENMFRSKVIRGYTQTNMHSHSIHQHKSILFFSETSLGTFQNTQKTSGNQATVVLLEASLA